MKRSTAPWRTALAAATLLSLPASGLAQTPPASQSPSTAPSEQPAVDQDAARRALGDARDTLSQLTQLPAAAQLTGETRTQVSQLINNFNELISSQSDWRGPYAKVQANMLALLGPETSVDEPNRPAPTGTPGAVGTTGAGAATMDPAIKAKLVEFRAKLNTFEKAAGTSTPSSSAPPSAATEPQKPASAQAAVGHDEAMRHIEAIEAILSGNSPTATSGTAPPGAAPVTLTGTLVTELKSHLAALKKLVAQAPQK